MLPPCLTQHKDTFVRDDWFQAMHRNTTAEPFMHAAHRTVQTPVCNAHHCSSTDCSKTRNSQWHTQIQTLGHFISLNSRGLHKTNGKVGAQSRYGRRFQDSSAQGGDQLVVQGVGTGWGFQRKVPTLSHRRWGNALLVGESVVLASAHRCCFCPLGNQATVAYCIQYEPRTHHGFAPLIGWFQWPLGFLAEQTKEHAYLHLLYLSALPHRSQSTCL